MTTCNIPNCNFILVSKNRGTKLHFFQIPKDPNKRHLWQEKVFTELDFKLTDKNRVCELHFEAKYILKDFVHIINGKEERFPRKKICLASDAVPTIFKSISSTDNPTIAAFSDITNTGKQLFKSPVKKTNHVDENSPQKLNITCNDSPKKPLNTYTKPPRSSLSPFSLALTPPSGNEGLITASTTTPSGNHDVSRTKRSATISVAQLELETNTNLNLTPTASKTKARTSSNERNLYELYNYRRSVKNKCVRIKKLQLKVKDLTKDIQRLRDDGEKIKNLAKRQQLVIKECLSNSSAKSSTGYRYSKEWILDSLLLKIKSTSTYNFLRDNHYLPLPSIPTLNRAVKNLKAEFGFDETLFASLKNKLSSLPKNERRGTLMFDEIQISKHLDFRPYEGKVIGKVDYGGVEHEPHSNRDGDHALVFYFQPLMGGWVQAIGAFCSAGATPAIVLTKLILQAIINLHQSGAIVDALVSDGASTNRSALTTLGFSAKGANITNSFQHPCDESQVIYIICDTPHIVKCIRNNLLKATIFLVPDGKVELSDFCQLLVADLNMTSSLRAAPKLTEAHINPNNFQKQSVRLATQLFSKSVATAMIFYKEVGFEGLQNCNATVTFTRRLNRLFDLLNSRTPRFGNGLRLTNGQIEELEEMLEWLVNWEAYYEKLPLPEPPPTKEGEKKKKPQRLFLSAQTCAALK